MMSKVVDVTDILGEKLFKEGYMREIINDCDDEYLHKYGLTKTWAGRILDKFPDLICGIESLSTYKWDVKYNDCYSDLKKQPGYRE